jgi:hypothetical protein
VIGSGHKKCKQIEAVKRGLMIVSCPDPRASRLGLAQYGPDANVGGVEAGFQNPRARSRPRVWSISSCRGGAHFT